MSGAVREPRCSGCSERTVDIWRILDYVALTGILGIQPCRSYLMLAVRRESASIFEQSVNFRSGGRGGPRSTRLVSPSAGLSACAPVPAALGSCRRKSTMQSVDQSVGFVQFSAQARRFTSHQALTASVRPQALPFGRLQLLGDLVDVRVKGVQQFARLSRVGVLHHPGIVSRGVHPSRDEWSTATRLTRG